MSTRLRPYKPASDCQKCASEQVDIIFHETGVIDSACWPAFDPADRVYVPHLCKLCLRCGYRWCEQTADAYAEGDPEEDPDMSIRKTATAEGVIGIEDAPGIVKTAAADTGWGKDDEAGLEQENESADQG